MNEKIKSFLVCYFLIPFAFYSADAFLHAKLLPERVSLLLIQLSLPIISWLTFRWLLSAKSFKIAHPSWGAWGASIGLIHWFPIYLLLAAMYIWNPVGGESIKNFDAKFILLYLANLILPMVTFSGATYDATLLVIPISIAIFFFTSKKYKANRI